MLTLLGNGITSATPGQLALSAGLAVLFAALGYRMSVRYRAVRGVTPWRLPSFAWAILCLLLQFVGIMIELLAEMTTRAPYSPTPASGAAHAEAGSSRFAPPTTAPVTVDPPTPGELPTFGSPLAVGLVDPQGGNSSHVLAPPLDAQGRPAPFGWYADPTGRHERRYFDGRRWSEHVVDGAMLAVDEL